MIPPPVVFMAFIVPAIFDFAVERPDTKPKQNASALRRKGLASRRQGSELIGVALVSSSSLCSVYARCDDVSDLFLVAEFVACHQVGQAGHDDMPEQRMFGGHFLKIEIGIVVKN